MTRSRRSSVGKLDTRAVEIQRLSRLVSFHAGRVTARQGKMRLCACDLCTRAMRRLEELRGDGC